MPEIQILDKETLKVAGIITLAGNTWNCDLGNAAIAAKIAESASRAITLDGERDGDIISEREVPATDSLSVAYFLELDLGKDFPYYFKGVPDDTEDDDGEESEEEGEDFGDMVQVKGHTREDGKVKVEPHERHEPGTASTSEGELSPESEEKDRGTRKGIAAAEKVKSEMEGEVHVSAHTRENREETTKNEIVMNISKKEIADFREESGMAFDSSYQFIGIKENEKLVSLLEYDIENEDKLVLRAAFTLPDYRKKGIARELVDTLIDELRITEVKGYNITSKGGNSLVQSGQKRVQVRAHTREGGKVEVSEYTRSLPSRDQAFTLIKDSIEVGKGTVFADGTVVFHAGNATELYGSVGKLQSIHPGEIHVQDEQGDDMKDIEDFSWYKDENGQIVIADEVEEDEEIDTDLEESWNGED